MFSYCGAVKNGILSSAAIMNFSITELERKLSSAVIMNKRDTQTECLCVMRYN